MGLPIEVNLKDAKQIALARLQDYVVESLMEVEPSIVMHGPGKPYGAAMAETGFRRMWTYTRATAR